MKKKKRVIGRPPKYGESLKRVMFSIRLDQNDWIELKSEEQGIPRSDFLRQILDKVMENENYASD